MDWRSGWREPIRASRIARRDERAGTVLVDWAQNSERRSTVAPYSLRAADRPSVAAPVSWQEIERSASRGDPLAFGPADVLQRLAERGDLFEAAITRVQALDAA
ncbi:MAG TPA: hypothetical protein VF712_02690 [Thermoleophilaceae bacterium]